jgi:hypothetical protein
MRVSGHGLQREGRAFDEAGNYTGQPTGYGRCECGEMSVLLDSTSARQRWHIQHKQEVSGAASTVAP